MGRKFPSLYCLILSARLSRELQDYLTHAYKTAFHHNQSHTPDSSVRTWFVLEVMVRQAVRETVEVLSLLRRETNTSWLEWLVGRLVVVLSLQCSTRWQNRGAGWIEILLPMEALLTAPHSDSLYLQKHCINLFFFQTWSNLKSRC